MNFDKMVQQAMNKGKSIKKLKPKNIRNIKFRRADTDYIYFPDRHELEKKDKSGRYNYAGHHIHAEEAGLAHWKKAHIVIGHQLANYVPIKREDTNTWFVVEDPKLAKEHGFEAYVGNEMDKYNIDQEAKDAWTGIVNEI
jgi:hypothetical protein